MAKSQRKNIKDNSKFHPFFLNFSVVQKSIYVPKNNLVCASKAGIDPKQIRVTGSRTHWRKIENFFNLLIFLGAFGKIRRLKIAQTIIPRVEIAIKFLVIFGKL